ncbi:FtsB family cell division protein [Candidatus Contubernalis alkaliaceticus]|uniref:FtsB family cell division protein n=1 Tax=Candidatus Contubernalis alkaliaceticus TaxID=338645 RepID=UPI001F4BFAB1|nr:septum formation initiator family protein [Candidatus Contubernalis alkalaceticus]UNC90711.1 septum formation initiator family protein [Candidatus Contubernalis alkalaceticus]
MRKNIDSRDKVLNYSKYKKNKSGRRTNSFSSPKAVFFVFFLLVLYFSGLFINQHLKVLSMDAQLSALKEDITIAENEKDKLLKEVELLHNPEYIEILARKELGLIKSGEVLFKVDKDRYVFKEKER